MALSEDILGAFEGSDQPTNLGELFDRIEGKGFGLLLAVLSIPSALPVPAPGYSIPFALVLFPLAVQMLKGRTTPWLPDKLRAKPIKAGGGGVKFFKAAAKFIRFWEKLIKPRGVAAFRSPLLQRTLAIAVLACSVSMMLPIPLTNTLPALGIFLISLGLLEEDIVFAIFGLIVAAAGLTITGLILFAIFALFRSGFSGGFGEMMDQAEMKVKAMLGR
jgi:hypothetical protein